MDEKTQLISGHGINDSLYKVSSFKGGKMIWRCPFYITWKDILLRVYNETYHAKRPAYADCSIDPLWLTFSNFRSWMNEQDWKGNQIDKDIMFPGNKWYSPLTCCFVSRELNQLLTNRSALRGDYPQGVDLYKHPNKYRASIHIKGKQKHLGLFDTPEKASNTYLQAKANHVRDISSEQSDFRVRDGLIRHAELFESKITEAA